jgi:hypothetical protein
MRTKGAILSTRPTSYWSLDDLDGSSCHDEMGLRGASAKVHPQHGSGPITVGGTQTTAFKGAIAHLALWNRLLSPAEIASIWTAGANDLRDAAMYQLRVSGRRAT